MTNHWPLSRHHRGFTLIEALIASLIAFIMGMSIILTIIHSIHQKQFERERAVALNRATMQIEELKRLLFPAVSSGTQDITLDIHNTPDDASDDIAAELIVRLRHFADGSTITSTAANAGIDRAASDAVEVECSVRWTTRSRQHVQTVNTMLTP